MSLRFNWYHKTGSAVIGYLLLRKPRRSYVLDFIIYILFLSFYGMECFIDKVYKLKIKVKINYPGTISLKTAYTRFSNSLTPITSQFKTYRSTIYSTVSLTSSPSTCALRQT